MHGHTTHITLLDRLRDEPSPTAWDEFCDRYGELIRSFARRQGLQAADCDDVMQDVLVAVSGALREFRYDPEQGKFRSYLKTITLRVIFRRFRQNQRRGGQVPNDEAARAAADDAQIDQHWESEWRRYHMRLAMRTIDAEFSEQDRSAFRLYALSKRSASETADALGMSQDQVYQAKSRITARLSAIVAAQIEDEG